MTQEQMTEIVATLARSKEHVDKVLEEKQETHAYAVGYLLASINHILVLAK